MNCPGCGDVQVVYLPSRIKSLVKKGRVEYAMEAALFAFGDVIIWITRLIVVGIAVYGLLTKNLLLFTIGISGMGGGILGWSICEVLIGNRLYGLLGIFGGLLLIWGGAAYREWCYKNNRVTQITFLLTPVRKRDPIVKGPNEKEEEYMDRMR